MASILSSGSSPRRKSNKGRPLRTWATFEGPGPTSSTWRQGTWNAKGTLELVDAFLASVVRGFDATLTCVLAGRDRVQVSMRGSGYPDAVRQRLRLVPRLDASPGLLRWFYSCFDVIVQPSRVEGFGLCPLEALCCGVPAVVTTGTGHLAWLGSDTNPTGGVLGLALGEPRPMRSEEVDCLRFRKSPSSVRCTSHMLIFVPKERGPELGR